MTRRVPPPESPTARTVAAKQCPQLNNARSSIRSAAFRQWPGARRSQPQQRARRPHRPDGPQWSRKADHSAYPQLHRCRFDPEPIRADRLYPSDPGLGSELGPEQCRPARSSAEVGASRISNCGSETRAQANPSRCVMPLENSPRGRSVTSRSPASPSASVTLLPAGSGPTSNLARSTTSAAVSQLSNSGASGQTAIRLHGRDTRTTPRS